MRRHQTRGTVVLLPCVIELASAVPQQVGPENLDGVTVAGECAQQKSAGVAKTGEGGLVAERNQLARERLAECGAGGGKAVASLRVEHGQRSKQSGQDGGKQGWNEVAHESGWSEDDWSAFMASLRSHDLTLFVR